MQGALWAEGQSTLMHIYTLIMRGDWVEGLRSAAINDRHLFQNYHSHTEYNNKNGTCLVFIGVNIFWGQNKEYLLLRKRYSEATKSVPWLLMS